MKSNNLAIKLSGIKHRMPLEFIDALKCILMARAFLDTIRPHSDLLRKQAIDNFKPVIKNNGERITSWGNLYRADVNLTTKMYDFHRAGLVAKGFVADVGCCPFLTAEVMVRDAEFALIDLLEPYTDISNRQLFNIEKKTEYISILMRLLTTLAVSQKIDLTS